MVRVTIIGAGGGIGQPLALLAKLNTEVTELRLADVMPIVNGVVVDLSHIPTPARVTGHHGADKARGALQDADIVLIPAGVPRKPGMTRDDLLNVNAKILRGIASDCAVACPKAFYGVITNPVNSMVPLFVETLVAGGMDRHDAERRTFGITTLDILRARTFYAQKYGLNPTTVDVPVVGGHAGATIIPLFSQVTPHSVEARRGQEEAHSAELAELVKETQDAGTKVVEAKDGQGSATLSMAYAAAEFLTAMISARRGVTKPICAYVRSDVHPGTEYFASKVLVGSNGIVRVLPVGELSAAEQGLLGQIAAELNSSIEGGKRLAAL